MIKDWTFKSKSTASTFNTHVREQLPWYDLATDMVAMIARGYLSDGGMVYDIGSSTGNIGISLSSVLLQRKAKLIAIEESENMANQYSGGGELFVCDAVDFEYEPFSVAICFLTLMFIDEERRQILLNKLYNNVKKGGCVIVVDKFQSNNGYLSTLMHRITMEWKLRNGASPSSVIDKELSLSGIQRPLNYSELDGYIEFMKIGEFSGFILSK